MKSLVILNLSVIVISGLMLINPTILTSGTEEQTKSTSAQPSAKDNFLKYCAGCHGTQMERFAGNTWEAYSAGNDLSPEIGRAHV